MKAEPPQTRDVNREAELTAITRIGSGDWLDGEITIYEYENNRIKNSKSGCGSKKQNAHDWR